jgi:hypothetical protein
MSVRTRRQDIIILFWKQQFHFSEYINGNQTFIMDSHGPFICSAEEWLLSSTPPPPPTCPFEKLIKYALYDISMPNIKPLLTTLCLPRVPSNTLLNKLCLIKNTASVTEDLAHVSIIFFLYLRLCGIEAPYL